MRTDKQYPIRVFNPSHAQTSFTITTKSGSRNSDNFVFLEDLTEDEFVKVSPQGLKKAGVTIAQIEGREIRKLTPLETMRLMGLEEGHIKLLDGFTPNQIYKLMGNSIVVPVLEKVLYNYFKTLMDEGYL
jgi:site-specific DNA-cytosine methylase